jgi:hypothetical protein
MPAITNDAEMDVVLSLLAGESSDSIRTKLMAIMTGKNLAKRWRFGNLKVPAQSVHAE